MSHLMEENSAGHGLSLQHTEKELGAANVSPGSKKQCRTRTHSAAHRKRAQNRNCLT
jgi:hypothetical protein